mgnify:FL=1
MTIVVTEQQYRDRHGPPPAGVAERLPTLLAQAVRRILAEAAQRGIDLEARITAGQLDPELLADVACRMVAEVVNAPAVTGVESVAQTAGAFSQTVSYGTQAGRMWLRRDDLRLLGITAAAAYTVAISEPAEDGWWEDWP